MTLGMVRRGQVASTGEVLSQQVRGSARSGWPAARAVPQARAAHKMTGPSPRNRKQALPALPPSSDASTRCAFVPHACFHSNTDRARSVLCSVPFDVLKISTSYTHISRILTMHSSMLGPVAEQVAEASAEGTGQPYDHTRSSSIDGGTIRGTDENVEQKPVDGADKEDEGITKEEYEPHELTWPDGGLRAWLVALGVRPFCFTRLHPKLTN